MSPEATTTSVLRYRSRWLMLCAAIACLPLGGCSIFGIVGVMADTYTRTGSHEVFTEYEGLRGKSFAVVITADRSMQSSDPACVNRLTNGITNMLVANQQLVGFSGFVPGSRVLEFQYNTPSWSSWSYGRVADEFVVDRLIVIDIFEYRLQEPGNAHVWNGVIAARVGVMEADSGSDEFVFTKQVQVTFPDADGYTPTDMTKGHVRATLENRFVERVAWLMFDHEEPNEMEY